MKTNIESPARTRISQTPHPIADSARGVFGRLVTAIVCGLLVCFTAAPQLQAQSPNGTYKVIKASGQLTIGGETMKLDDKMAREIIGLAKGEVVVAKNRMKLDRKAAASIMNKLGKEFGIKVQSEISGPKTVALNKSGKAFVGKTSKPVQVKFKANVQGQTIRGAIHSHFRVNVQGKKLVMDIPITGNLMGQKVKGRVKVICAR